METTAATSLFAALGLGLVLGLALGGLAATLWLRPRAEPDRARDAERAIAQRAAEQALVQAGLERIEGHVRALEEHRTSWQAQLKQQVDDVRRSTEALRRETASLSTALRKPQVRGRWGELHLRRAVELAGLVDRCDFAEQVVVARDEARLRPDLVVRLAGGRNVAVDSKVPLDAFLDATGSESDADRAAHLERHARQLRRHVDALAAKSYWRALAATPEFVVLFVPGEAFLSAALDVDPALIEYAAERQVVLATPTTLIALLRTVAHAWTQEVLADKAREIHLLGRELYERLGTMGGHLDQLGRSLSAAVTNYNRAVGTLETRVLVSARKFAEMGVDDGALIAPRRVETSPRQLGARELLDVVEQSREPLPDRRGAREDPRSGDRRRAREGA
jgi:DNA recombination protein RmuC